MQLGSASVDGDLPRTQQGVGCTQGLELGRMVQQQARNQLGAKGRADDLHRNAIVFDGVVPSIPNLIQQIENEGRTWQKAGILKGQVDALFDGLARWAWS